MPKSKSKDPKNKDLCIKIHGMIDDYVDGLLSPLEDREVKAHLNVCIKCRADVEKLFSLIEGLESFTLNVSNELNHQIQEEVKKDGKWRKQKRAVTLRYLAASLLLISTITSGIYYYPRIFPRERIGDNVSIHSLGKTVVIEGDTLPGNLTVVGGDVYVKGEVMGAVTSVGGQVSASIGEISLFQRIVEFFRGLWQRVILGGEAW